MDKVKFPQKLTNYLNFRAQPLLKKQISIWHIVELLVRPTVIAILLVPQILALYLTSPRRPVRKSEQFN